jgi:hypothetical protein
MRYRIVVLIDNTEQMPYARIAWYAAGEEGTAEEVIGRDRFLLRGSDGSTLDEQTRDLLVEVLENL